MADQHHRALEFVQGHGQGLPGGQVQVVGGLVEQQQVGSLPHDHAQHQPGLFAAAHGAHGLLHHVAAELETPQEVAQVLLAQGLAHQGTGGFGFAGQSDHVGQWRVVRPQHVQLLLREVADAQALALSERAAQQGQGAGHGFHEGGFALTVGPENAQALPGLHRAGHVLHDHRVHPRVAAVAEAGVAQVEHGVGQLARFVEGEAEFGIGQHRRDLFHALQGLDAALRLLGFGGLGLEAIDELLEVRDLVLLAGKGGLLLADLLGPHVFETAVVAAVAGEFAVVDVQGDLRYRIQKFAIVADDEQRAFVAFEPAFQPDQGVEVQVVGGFVQHEQVARAHERTGQLQPHAPAARKAVDRTLEFVDLEAQSHQQGLGAGGGVVGAGVMQGGVGVGHGLTVAAGFGGVHLLLCVAQAGVTVDHEGGGGLVRLGHVLRHLGEAPLARPLEVAAVFVQMALQQRKQAGFAGTVAADQTDVFAGVDGGVRAVEDDLGAAPQGHVAQGDHAAPPVR